MRKNFLLSTIGGLGFAITLAASAGCTEPVETQDQACGEVRAAELADPNAMPAEIIAYLDEHHWSHMHLDFHVARMWDVLGADTQQWATDQGIERWKQQEGEAGTGLEFLAMHRLMLTELREKFPDQVALFAGWDAPPTELDDPAGPLPSTAGPFRADMRVAIDRLQNRIGEFASDDDMALYLQTTRRPTAGNPRGTSTERGAGIHNYVHGRWTERDSPINVGDPALNLGNRIFWRIHGWVDARWTAYRMAKGLDDATDPAYLQATADAQAWMEDVMQHADHANKVDDGCEHVPDEVRDLFVR